MFVAENVYGLMTMPGEPIKQIMRDFSGGWYDVGYQVVSRVWDTSNTKTCYMGISKRRRRMRILLMAGILLQKNKIECFVKYFEHLKEPDDRRYFADGVFKGEET
jgi:site-specific DNA-cytosine methylase